MLSPLISLSLPLKFLKPPLPKTSSTAMATSPPLTPLTTFLLSLKTLILLSIVRQSYSDSIHDLLRSQGLPAGLLPREIKSFTLDPNGLLEVDLFGPCLTKFENRVYFESVIRGNLSYGELRGLEGLSQEELFLWLPIKDIIVDDPSSGLILFDVGVVHKQFSLSLFEDPPHCKPVGDIESGVTGKKKGFDVL